MGGVKKLLIAGGGYADIPLILSAKKLGCRVLTSGNRPEDLGHAYADRYCPADFSDPEALLAVAVRENIDAICACCNDFSALSSAYVAERLGLPGHDSYETSKKIHHKDSYRRLASEQGLSAPGARGFDSLDAALGGSASLMLPLVIKPVDLTGGKGISIVQAAAELPGALKRAFDISRVKRIVVEEFVAGSRHGYSAFLRDGRVVFSFVDNEHYFLNPFMVSAASTPGDVTEAAQQRLRDAAEQLADALSLVDGIFHVQFILRDGEPVIIEICRRAPGDLYIRFVEHATGVPYPEWIVRASAGLACDGLSQALPTGFFTRHVVMSDKPGTVKEIVFDRSIAANVIDKMMWGQPGDSVSDVMTSKFGVVFLSFESREEMLDKTERMQELIRVVTE